MPASLTDAQHDKRLTKAYKHPTSPRPIPKFVSGPDRGQVGVKLGMDMGKRKGVTVAMNRGMPRGEGGVGKRDMLKEQGGTESSEGGGGGG